MFVLIFISQKEFYPIQYIKNRMTNGLVLYVNMRKNRV